MTDVKLHVTGLEVVNANNNDARDILGARSGDAEFEERLPATSPVKLATCQARTTHQKAPRFTLAAEMATITSPSSVVTILAAYLPSL